MGLGSVVIRGSSRQHQVSDLYMGGGGGVVGTY